MRAYILSGLLLSLLVSCKDDKAKKDQVATEEDKPFTVTLNAVVNKDDIFQVFYNEDGGDSFAPNDVITVNVKGSSQPQDLVFVLPEEITPLNLRFDIGGNPELGQVPFKGFKLNFRNSSFNADSAQFIKYFFPNPSIEFDSVNVVAKLKVVDGVYDPILSSKEDLKKEILKFYEKK